MEKEWNFFDKICGIMISSKGIYKGLPIGSPFCIGYNIAKFGKGRDAVMIGVIKCKL